MKSFRVVTIMVLTAVILAPAAFGADFGVRAGRYNDGEEEFVGAEVAWDTGALTFNPNIEYALAQDVTVLSGNFDVLYNFGRATVRPFVGAGLGVYYTDVDDPIEGQDQTTDALFNVIGGVKFKLDFLEPYAQVKYFRLFEEGGGDDIALTIGLRF